MKRTALAVAVVAVLALPTAAFAADTITIDPMEGPPGTEVTIELQADHELGDDQFAIDFRRDLDDPDNFTAADPSSFDDNGFARVTFVVPDAEPGFYELVMSCLGVCDETKFNAGESAGIGFTVTESLPNTAMAIPGHGGLGAALALFGVGLLAAWRLADRPEQNRRLSRQSSSRRSIAAAAGKPRK